MDLAKVGDDVFIENELRTVVALGKNNRGDLTVRWKSHKSQGTCVPALWWDWCCYENGEEVNGAKV